MIMLTDGALWLPLPSSITNEHSASHVWTQKRSNWEIQLCSTVFCYCDKHRNQKWWRRKAFFQFSGSSLNSGKPKQDLKARDYSNNHGEMLHTGLFLGSHSATFSFSVQANPLKDGTIVVVWTFLFKLVIKKMSHRLMGWKQFLVWYSIFPDILENKPLGAKELQFWAMDFKSLWLVSNISSLSKRRTTVVSTFLPMRNRFACFLAWKSMLQDLMDSWKVFLHPVDCRSIFLVKVAEMLEEIVVGWQEVQSQWTSQMRQNLIVQFVELLECWLCNVQSSMVLNCALSDELWCCKHCWFWRLLSVYWAYFS